MKINKTFIPLLEEAYIRLKNFQFAEFHALLEQTVLDLSLTVVNESPKDPASLALFCALQAEEYLSSEEYDLSLRKINQAQKLDNNYLFLVFQACLYEQTREKEYKIIPIYDELLTRKKEKNTLPEVLELFIMNNLGTAWFRVGTSPDWHQKKYGETAILDHSEHYYLEVLKSSKQIEVDYSYLIINSLNGLANIEAKKKNIKKAISYFEVAIEANQSYKSSLNSTNYPDLLANSLNGLGWCHFQKQEFETASAYYTQANRTVISNLGEEHEVTTKLTQNLSMAWKERVGVETHGFSQIKLEGKKSSQPFRNTSTPHMRPINPKSTLGEPDLFIGEEISQKYFPLTWLFPSISKVLLQI